MSHLPTRLDDNSAEEILIKLPVKSFMRFKCVSKKRQSLIQDPSFAKSHHRRSKKIHPPQLLISIDSTYPYVSKIFYSPENEFKGGVAVPRMSILWNQQPRMLKPIDGLFCFVDDTYGVTCIYNLWTRQVTPWAQSCMPIQGGESVKHKPIFGFGVDPVTNNYKVVRVWEISRAPAVTYGDIIMGRVDDYICEVFTVGGENQWRKIDEVPPVRLFGGYAGVYANGSIYWKNVNSINDFLTPDNKVIVAFDVGTEKFRVIQIPVGSPGWSSIELIQIDGYIALMDRSDACDVVTLRISDDDSYKEKKMTTNWTQETIWLLPCLQQGHLPLDLNPVQGTDEVIIKSRILYNDRDLRGSVTLYIYNRTMLNFQTIDITCIAPLLAYPYYHYNLYIFHESLVPLQKPAAKEEKLNQLTSHV